MKRFEGFENRSSETLGRTRADHRSALRPLQRAHLDSNLITEFFFVFSRFEYALKRAGFLKPKRRNAKHHKAEPCWDGFADSAERRYDPDESPELARAINYLLGEPPKCQIVEDNGSLDWKDLGRGSETEIRWLLLLVRRVRNNLFHGGKYPYTPLPEPARDTRLLESSLMVLEACLGWDDKVRRYYMSDLDG
jgi:hypothetical protein